VNFWLLTLILINLLLITFIVFNWVLRTKITQEDQRLTKGLQLLQNKISILQDLSDKSDEQVRRWVHLIEQKSSDVQAQLNFSDEKIIQMESVLSKALDVSKIFYDQVPHAEIMERQKTSKYVQAAQLANQGFTADQISQKVELNTAEIEMIIRLNREQLQFSEENLPAWIETMKSQAHSASSRTEVSTHRQEIEDFGQQLKKMNQMVSSTAFDTQKLDLSSMQTITQKFNESVSQTATHTVAATSKNAPPVPQTFVDESKSNNAGGEKEIKPFEFRRITTYRN
jgi:hypothetical protein